VNKKSDKQLILRTIKDWGKLLILMLDEAAIIIVILLVLHFLGVQITLPIKIVAGIVFILFVFIRHVAVLPSFHRKQVTGREGIIGEQGRVVESLTPKGVIIVRGEYWRARSVDDKIYADENVEIVGLEGLTLTVKRKR
jgi:membrane protein implicated in regulation of membrane protease activity